MRFTRGFGDGIRVVQPKDRTANRSAAVAVVERTSPASEALQRARRAPPNPRDANLSTMAAGWCVRFDPELRPVNLCRRYPRVANRLALCWEDGALTARIFRELLTDRRGNRRGFPPEVQRELNALIEARTAPPVTADQTAPAL